MVLIADIFKDMVEILIMTLMALYFIGLIVAVFMIALKDKRSRSGDHS